MHNGLQTVWRAFSSPACALHNTTTQLDMTVPFSDATGFRIPFCVEPSGLQPRARDLYYVRSDVYL